ncbi:STAS domain-containing protein [Wenzhouxiangella sp. XN201]|uniref:STAS domain-containing protein n=1 Tax=Wenzhouxiangella sp. XN201 TaxID=2710755 RepID=UPI0013CAB9E1|nr:STAS domain-containing protein [Wenzhouxiangella sp. XN201]NEZ03507.1 STAS domain-containing protein [Wenzhouxiangella sp. XN201]
MTDQQHSSIQLSGHLTVGEVPAVHARWHNRFASDSPPEQVDLAALEAADSSALALLLEWQALARKSGRSVRFESPPPALVTIARLTGVGPMLGWADTDNDESEKER